MECKEWLVNRLFRYDRLLPDDEETRAVPLRLGPILRPPATAPSQLFHRSIDPTAEQLYGVGRIPGCFIFTVIIQFSE